MSFRDSTSKPRSATQRSRNAVQTASTATRLKQAANAPRMALRRLDPRDDEQARRELEQRVASRLPGQLELTVTDNRHTMISVRRHGSGRFRVRLHHMFLAAPASLAHSLAHYVAHNCPDASRELGTFIEAQQHKIRRVRGPGRVQTADPRGEHFDLQDIFDSLNEEHFGGCIEATITWGRRGTRRGRRRNSIKMGSYSVEDRLIRIHPSLDRDFVPRYFVEWIVFHEMLHQVHEIPVVNGRRVFHPPAFLAQERQFPAYERARRWERAHLDRLLSY